LTISKNASWVLAIVPSKSNKTALIVIIKLGLIRLGSKKKQSQENKPETKTEDARFLVLVPD
ncbi:MAG: hypothetical protein ACKO2V_11235, partial [Snowella sp.]